MVSRLAAGQAVAGVVKWGYMQATMSGEFTYEPVADRRLDNDLAAVIETIRKHTALAVIE